MGQLNKPLDSLEILDNITNMKQRITKTKLLAKLTKMVNEAADKKAKADRALEFGIWQVRYETLLEVRDYININRI